MSARSGVPGLDPGTDNAALCGYRQQKLQSDRGGLFLLSCDRLSGLRPVANKTESLDLTGAQSRIMFDML